MEIQFTDKQITTFWDAINSYTIVIPQIQRDYAQGRKDPDTEYIRVNIIKKFYKAISNPLERATEIDFIYGYVRNNEFIPLDGQQRLTTLFLVHWYLAKRSGEDLLQFLNFRYETRQSSTDFCKALINASFTFDSKELDLYITDQRWFYHSWKKDPTIISMLTMIQEIHTRFGCADHSLLWENLTNEGNPRITFNFLELDGFGLNDDLYVKMNSRGKALSRFENFKVWINKNKNVDKEWRDKIDDQWTTLFWENKDELIAGRSGENIIDKQFMHFINGMLMYELALKDNKDEVHFFFNTNDIPLSKYEKINCFSEEAIQQIINTLDWFCVHHANLSTYLEGIELWSNETLFKTFITSSPGYKDLVAFYALVTFANNADIESDVSLSSFRRWIRTLRNLIENTLIDSPERFIRAIKSIHSIGVGCLDIYTYLTNTESENISFFGAQVIEEKKKIQFIESDILWEEEFLKSENHPLFRGSISFLIQNRETFSLESFKANSEIAYTLFKKNGSNELFKSDYLLIRSTLAKSDINENIRLVDNADNWRALLKRETVQTAIFSIIGNLRNEAPDNYLNVLERIIDQFSDKAILWKYYIIKCKVLLCSNASRSKYVKNYYGIHYLFNNEGGNWINNDNQFLLSNFRNELIQNILIHNSEFKLVDESEWMVKNDLETGLTFYRGEHIELKKNLGDYSLKLRFKPDALIAGFHQEQQDFLQVLKNEYSPINSWLLAQQFYYPTSDDQLELWVKNILHQIAILESLVKPNL